jgi:hypothetical protein
MKATLITTEPPLDIDARRELAAALAALHQQNGFVVRAADLLGRTFGYAGQAILRRFGLHADHPALTAIAEKALTRAYDVAILGINLPGPQRRAGIPLAAASGIAGGLAGPLGFLPDATFTTLLIMREIATIARAEGEDLTTEAGRAACVQVFSLRSGDEAGYFSARLMLQGTAARGLLASVAARWGAVLGEKFAAQAVPLAGAAAGATLNTAFLDHYRRLARAHFTIRRLERTYGEAAVRAVAPELAPVVDARFEG